MKFEKDLIALSQAILYAPFRNYLYVNMSREQNVKSVHARCFYSFGQMIKVHEKVFHFSYENLI